MDLDPVLGTPLGTADDPDASLKILVALYDLGAHFRRGSDPFSPPHATKSSGIERSLALLPTFTPSHTGTASSCLFAK